MFTIELNENETREYTSKGRAVRAANGFAKTREITIQVVDPEGMIAHVATPVVDRRFNPGERVVTPSFPAPYLRGWVPAYLRAKITTVVYRSDVHDGLLVLDGRTGGIEHVANTTVARELTNTMGQGARIAEGKRPAVLDQAADQAA